MEKQGRFLPRRVQVETCVPTPAVTEWGPYPFVSTSPHIPREFEALLSASNNDTNKRGRAGTHLIFPATQE